jgi:ankyrin repeat protein
MCKRIAILFVTLFTGIVAGWAIRDMIGGRAQFELNDAAGRGDLREMKRLVSRGADPLAEAYDKSTGQGGGTPLFAAAANGEAEAVEYLIQSGANVNTVEATETPLDMASYRRKQAEKTISILMAHGAKKLIELNNKEPNKS